MLNRQEPIELECRPVLKDVICRFGEKCFHDVHYLCSFSQPDGSCSKEACIPEDACVFDAIVTNLDITSVERSNGCARVCGNYDLFVFFRFDEQRQVGQAVRNNVPFCVQVPMSSVNDGCQEIVCEGGKRFETKVCAFNTRLEVVEAVAEQDNTDANICPGCGTRIRVTVEKVFRAFEHGKQVLCIPVCPPEVCVPVPTTVSPFCPPFTRPTECPSFCQDDEFFFPDFCDQCPPPQGTIPPTTVAPTEPPTTKPPTTQPPTTKPPKECDCFATGGGNGIMPSDAFPVSSRGEDVSLGFNACPGCNFQANVTFNTRIDDEANTLFGRELIAMTCNPTSTMATIDGAGEFGRGFFSFFFCSLRHLCCHLPPAFLSKGLLF
ncbi:MAG: hypothetical protein ACOX1Y_03145 [Zhaonellaceae bacterium]|nr:hypothetical protein [Clostridia bacterium]